MVVNWPRINPVVAAIVKSQPVLFEESLKKETTPPCYLLIIAFECLFIKHHSPDRKAARERSAEQGIGEVEV